MTAYGPLALIARGKPSRALLLMAVLYLAACAGAKPREPNSAAMSSALVPPLAMMSAPPPMPPEITAPPMEIMPPSEMAPPPAPPPEPPPPPPTDGPGLRAAYGAPDFVRREDDSELWRYDVEGCAVFFFLYREGNALKIRYAETSPRGKEAPVDPACFKGLNARGVASASRRMS